VTGAPDYIAAIVGWRVWAVLDTDDGTRLASVYYRVPWPVRHRLSGECFAGNGLSRFLGWHSEGHLAPNRECQCGIYAARDVTNALQHLRATHRPLHSSSGLARTKPFHYVLGWVSLWGDVVECRAGWRAEHAYPQRIFVPARTLASESVTDVETIAESLADYGVPVEILAGVGTGSEIARVLGPQARAA
jgi:hypothetical protein